MAINVHEAREQRRQLLEVVARHEEDIDLMLRTQRPSGLEQEWRYRLSGLSPYARDTLIERYRDAGWRVAVDSYDDEYLLFSEA